MIRILIVDDHEVVRRGLRAYLGLEADFAVIDEASDGQAAVEKFKDKVPDVVLLDLHMEPVDGLEALKQIKRINAAAKVIVLTSFFDALHVLPAIEAGAAGYLVKTADASTIAHAVREVFRGKTIFDADAMQSMANAIQQRAAIHDLTEREFDVLKLLAKGLSNQEIADTLFIGVKTVKTHVSNILSKLNVQDRTQAAVYAIEHGIK